MRVLVVDDSAFARKIVSEALTAGGFEVVGIARDGLEGLEKIAELRPDVVTLDMQMPNLDGLGMLRAMAQDPGRPRVILVTTSEADSPLAIAALAAGALDLVHKPTSIASAELREIAGPLIEKVRAAAGAKPPVPLPDVPRTGPPRFAPPPARNVRRAAVRIVAIGASTGGPQAVARVIRALPADFPAPVAVVLHMPPGYTASYAERLANEAKLEVVEAAEGTILVPGRVVIGRGGIHLRVVSRGQELACRLDINPLSHLHRPSVDVLLESVAREAGAEALAAILTGMGDDGVAGARALKARGGAVLAEHESSCVVYGMPRTVVEAGLADGVVPIEEMAAEIVRRAVAP